MYDGENAIGKVVSEGFALTGPDVDYTVKVSLLFPYPASPRIVSLSVESLLTLF